MEISRQHYTEEFKQEAVKLVRESGLSIAEAGRRLNIPAMTLKNWIYRVKSSKSGVSSGRPVSDIEAENSRLRKELAESRLECEIIKKAMAYFAKESLPGTRR
jgi:transposase